MSSTIPMNVSLTPELKRLVEEKVQTGLYGNASEVVREALRRMDTNDELVRELQLLRLREAVPGLEAARRGKFSDQGVSQIAAEAEQKKYGA